MPSMNDDIAQYGVYMVNPNGKIRKINITSTDDYNHYLFELHHFIPKSIRKINREMYEKIEHLQKLILIPRGVHQRLHACCEGFSYNGLKWYDLLFNRRKWREGYYENIWGLNNDN